MPVQDVAHPLWRPPVRKNPAVLALQIGIRVVWQLHVYASVCIQPGHAASSLSTVCKLSLESLALQAETSRKSALRQKKGHLRLGYGRGLPSRLF